MVLVEFQKKEKLRRVILLCGTFKNFAMSDAVKPLEEQLQEQQENLENNIRQTEAQLSRLKEQYLKVLGALEFASIQKQQSETTETSDPVTEVVSP